MVMYLKSGEEGRNASYTETLPINFFSSQKDLGSSRSCGKGLRNRDEHIKILVLIAVMCDLSHNQAFLSGG